MLCLQVFLLVTNRWPVGGDISPLLGVVPSGIPRQSGLLLNSFATQRLEWTASGMLESSCVTAGDGDMVRSRRLEKFRFHRVVMDCNRTRRLSEDLLDAFKL